MKKRLLPLTITIIMFMNAYDGELDTTFGNKGILTINFGSTDAAHTSLVQPDNKLIASGKSGSYFAIARTTQLGILDNTFSDDGKATTIEKTGKTTTDFGGVTDYAYATAIQSDGKIIAAGSSNNNFAIARYNSNGALDTSFGTAGKTTTDLGGTDEAYATAIQSDGKIITVGYSNTDFALARYNSDGSLDTSFGTGGKVTTSFSALTDAIYGIAIQSDGKIVAVGYSNNDFAIARYSNDGSLDTSFGTGGKVTTNFGGTDIARAIAIQSNEKIIAVGYSNASGNNDFALSRYTSGGSLDTSFGTAGKVTTNFSGASIDQANSAAIQSDGKIIAVGYSNASGSNDFAVARYTSGGSLDTGFGDNASTTNETYASILLRNGSIITAGYTDTDFALVGYLYDGSLDTSFGSNGITTTDFGGTDKAYAIAEQQEGLLIVAGVSDSNFALARYNNAGVLDSTFGSSGLVTTDFGGTDQANAVVIQDDKKIIAIGTSDSNFALARYAKNGSLDSTFGSNGIVYTDIGGTDQIWSINVQPDAKIFAAGDNGTNFVLARYLVPSIKVSSLARDLRAKYFLLQR